MVFPIGFKLAPYTLLARRPATDPPNSQHEVGWGRGRKGAAAAAARTGPSENSRPHGALHFTAHLARHTGKLGDPAARGPPGQYANFSDQIKMGRRCGVWVTKRRRKAGRGGHSEFYPHFRHFLTGLPRRGKGGGRIVIAFPAVHRTLGT